MENPLALFCWSWLWFCLWSIRELSRLWNTNGVSDRSHCLTLQLDTCLFRQAKRLQPSDIFREVSKVEKKVWKILENILYAFLDKLGYSTHILQKKKKSVENSTLFEALTPKVYKFSTLFFLHWWLPWDVHGAYKLWTLKFIRSRGELSYYNYKPYLA